MRGFGPSSMVMLTVACGPAVVSDDASGDATDADTAPSSVTTRGDTGDAPEPQPDPEPEPPSRSCFAARIASDVILAADGRLSLADTRGDGLPEIWVTWVNEQASPPHLMAIGHARAGQSYDSFAFTSMEGTCLWWSDLNASGRDDAISCPRVDGQIQWTGILSDASGVPSSEVALVIPSLERPIAWFDVTFDDRADMFTSEAGLLQIWRGDGTGVFSPTTNTPLSPWNIATSVRPSRFDGRAFAATLATDVGDDSKAVTLLGIAPGGALVRYATSDTFENPRVLDMRPIDADDRPDVVIQHDAPVGDSVVLVLIARNDGELPSVLEIPGVQVAAAGDFDGDGSLDLLWSDGQQTFVKSRLPQDDEAHTVEVALVASPSPDAIAVGDLDGDGREEIVQLRRAGDGSEIEIIEVVDCG